MTLEPLYDQILVLELHQEQMLDGILLPETSREDTKFGKVVSVGEGYVQRDGVIRPLRLQKGDTIGFGMYSGIPVQLEGVTFLLMKEGEALFRVNDND
jgi:chaperonin GroES